MTTKNILLAAAVLFLFNSASRAEEMEKMESDTATTYGEYLSNEFGKTDGLQVKVEADPSKAVGLQAGGGGIIIVPTKGLKEGSEDPAADTERGAPMAYLFMSQRFNPLKEGKPFDGKKLRTVDLADSGNKATCLVLSARHIQDDEWQMYVYGADKKPIVSSQFFPAEEESDGPIGIHVQDPADGKATLVVTVFGKYEATLPIGHKFD